MFFRDLHFDIYQCDRPSQQGGGVLIAIKNCISSFCLRVCANIEAVFICIAVDSEQTIFGVCYQATKSGSEYCDTLHTVLLDIQGLYPKADFVTLATSIFQTLTGLILQRAARMVYERVSR